MKIFLLILLLIFFNNCTKKEYGNKIESSRIVQVKNLKLYPLNYLNSIILIKGKVVEESSKGLWINVNDDGFTISVNFEKSKIKLGNLMSKRVVSAGRFVKTNDGYIIEGIYLKVLD